MKITKPSKRAPAPPPPRETAIPVETVQQAMTRLDEALSNNEPLVRAHAIEGIRQSQPDTFEPQLLSALDDQSAVVRMAACLAVGELRIKAAHPKLEKLAADDDNQVQIAARYALHRLGDTRLSQDLVMFAKSDKANVRGTTVMVFGMLGETSALPILTSMQTDRNPAVRLQVSEAMWRLGSEQGLENLVASSVSAYPDDQAIAFLALAEPRDQRIIEHVRAGLTADYDEPRLVAARAMGMLGSDEGYVIAKLGTQSDDPRKRVLGALAFGAIDRKDAIDFLTPLLSDANPDVRIAAATAVLQLNDQRTETGKKAG